MVLTIDTLSDSLLLSRRHIEPQAPHAREIDQSHVVLVAVDRGNCHRPLGCTRDHPAGSIPDLVRLRLNVRLESCETRLQASHHVTFDSYVQSTVLIETRILDRVRVCVFVEHRNLEFAEPT